MKTPVPESLFNKVVKNVHRYNKAELTRSNYQTRLCTLIDQNFDIHVKHLGKKLNQKFNVPVQ